MYYSDAGGSDKDGEEINDEDLFGDEEDIQAQDLGAYNDEEEQIRDSDSDTGSAKHRRQVRDAETAKGLEQKKQVEE